MEESIIYDEIIFLLNKAVQIEKNGFIKYLSSDDKYFNKIRNYKLNAGVLSITNSENIDNYIRIYLSNSNCSNDQIITLLKKIR